MKRCVCVLLTLLFLLASCGERAEVEIEDCVWVLQSAYALKDSGDMSLEACAEDYPRDASEADAKVIQCFLTASKGELIIEDRTYDMSYTGEYGDGDTYYGSTMYAVFTYYDASGVAVTSMTRYYDGSERRTLVLRLGYYTLTFYEQ